MKTALPIPKISTPAQEFNLDIQGMSCASCVNRVEKALLKIEGVNNASVNLATECARIHTDNNVDIAILVSAIETAGYQATPHDELTPNAESHHLTNAGGMRVLGAALMTLPLIAPMLLSPFGVHLIVPGWLQLILATPVQFFFGGRFYLAGWNALKARTGNMDLLVALGTSAAYGLSLYQLLFHETTHFYFEAAAVVITLVLCGKELEARAKKQTTFAIRALQKLRPAMARIRRNGTDADIPIEQVKIGDIVVIRPGERVAVDGVVVEGTSHIDESLVTGENLPILKQQGDKVTGGAINTDGLLLVRTLAIGAETLLARIIRMVEDAQAEKAPIQHLVDKVSAVFVPVVLAIAFITCAEWLLYGSNTEMALINAVTVLVIACPCSLGLATPAAIMTGTGAAAKYGILIKDAEALETAHRISTVVFDKTGTLTEGRPQVVAIEPFGVSRNDLLQLVFSMQIGSEHALARAVINTAETEGISTLPATKITALPGRGLSACIEGQDVCHGSARLMKELNIEIEPLKGKADQLENMGYTISWTASTSDKPQLLGFIAFGDTIKPHAARAIQRLQSLGIHTILLTGDNQGSASSIGNRLGIEQIIANVLPAGKAENITSLKRTGQVIAMVGDGINDGPALAAADVGIAMSSGTDVALQAAGITLMRGDPALVADVIDISRRTYRKIRQNLFWAFIYNLIGIPLAVLGLLNPMVAGAAMALSSISVISNALMLLRWKPRT